MEITEQEKELIIRYAKILKCDWFAFDYDEKGNVCVLDKEENEKLELAQGLCQLRFYDGDNEEFLFLSDTHKLIIDGKKIHMYIESINKKSKLSASMLRFLEEYNYDINKINNLFTKEEKILCLELFHRAHVSRSVNRFRSIELLRVFIKDYEEKTKHSLLDDKLNDQLMLTKEEYNYILNKQFY